VKSWLGKLLLAVWAVAVLFGMAALSFGHISAMPDPEARLARELLALRRDPGKAFYVHVIYANCSCTQRLFAHLMERARFADANELVLFVGRDPDKQAAAERAGMIFVSTSPEELAGRHGIEAAPLLVAFDQAGRMRYLGGYYDHPSTIFPRDEKIHAQLAGGARAEPLPVFGCAVSARLQKSLDPLGIKY
jgi:hypothetical protein